MSLPAMSADIGFDTAARLVLDYLNTNIPLALWSITRIENGRQTFLYIDENNGYHKPRGDSHPWEDSFCIHMAAGRAPAIALDVQSPRRGRERCGRRGLRDACRRRRRPRSIRRR